MFKQEKYKADMSKFKIHSRSRKTKKNYIIRTEKIMFSKGSLKLQLTQEKNMKELKTNWLKDLVKTYFVTFLRE